MQTGSRSSELNGLFDSTFNLKGISGNGSPGIYNFGLGDGSNSGSSNWIGDIIKQGISLTSQIIAAKTNTVQTASGVPVYQQQQQQQQPYQTQQPGGIGTGAPNPNSGAGADVTGGLMKAFNGFAQSFGISPTMLAGGLAVGGYLLFRDPPKRR